MIEHLGGVGTAIHVIAEIDDVVRSFASEGICLDPLFGLEQGVQTAVDVRYDVDNRIEWVEAAEINPTTLK